MSASLRGSAAAAVRLDPADEERELAEYLGEAYDRTRLERYEQQLDEEVARIGDEQTLYRTSEAYLYNLAAFAMTGTKQPYLAELTRQVERGARLLDYGSGIGSDGLALMAAGYEVAFADFDNPSTRYLRWRLERRGVRAEIYDLDREQPPDDFELAYAFDVIEHVEDPFDFLARLERHAVRVLVNLLETGPSEQEIHRSLPIRALLDHAAGQRLLHYRRYHGRSHLVCYRSERARGLSSGISRARLLEGRLRAAVEARRSKDADTVAA